MLLRSFIPVVRLVAAAIIVAPLGSSTLHAGDGLGSEKLLPQPVVVKPKGYLNFVAVSPSGNVLAYGESTYDPPDPTIASHALRLIDLAAGKELWHVTDKDHRWSFREGVFSPDGKMLATGSLNPSTSCLVDVER